MCGPGAFVAAAPLHAARGRWHNLMYYAGFGLSVIYDRKNNEYVYYTQVLNTLQLFKVGSGGGGSRVQQKTRNTWNSFSIYERLTQGHMTDIDYYSGTRNSLFS